jgi:hydrogenase expression/formation protein HypE
MDKILPLGKLPVELLSRLLDRAPVYDPRVILGPGIGLDCAVLDLGENLLVLKSDPITFASEEIGWYLVQVNANDIATCGAVPRWLLVTALLPENKTTQTMLEAISEQVFQACREAGISVIGGHTEITSGLERPILMGTLIGEVKRERLITPQGARPGDRLLLTKGIPIEATALLARERPKKARQALSEAELEQASQFLFNPGISVLRDAQLAVQSGHVTAMHDPTEGGLAAALWELSEACGKGLTIEPEAIPIPELSLRLCKAFGLDPMASIASGALLMSAAPEDAAAICQALEKAGIRCSDIGLVEDRAPGVMQRTAQGPKILPRPLRDELTKIFERFGQSPASQA